MFTIGEYLRPGSVDEIWEAFGRATYPIRLLAGGTDLLPKIEPEALAMVSAVDLSNIPELTGIEATAQGLRIGAATRLADVEQSALLGGAWQVLAAAAGQVGSTQIRNLATLGGNVCNASPAADTACPLLVLGAEAEILSPQGRRVLPLSEFWLAPGKTVLGQDELLAALCVPTPPAGAVATYVKHSPRRAMDLAVVGVAVLLARQDGWLDARVALGAVTPTPIRAHAAEQRLRAAPDLGDGPLGEAARLAAGAARPIDDIRASAEYRVQMVRVLCERALRQAAANLPG
jgi:carbon-monoxide dehydrogenase medium subunit